MMVGSLLSFSCAEMLFKVIITVTSYFETKTMLNKLPLINHNDIDISRKFEIITASHILHCEGHKVLCIWSYMCKSNTIPFMKAWGKQLHENIPIQGKTFAVVKIDYSHSWLVPDITTPFQYWLGNKCTINSVYASQCTPNNIHSPALHIS